MQVFYNLHFNIITGGNLAMNKNQIQFKGSGDQNHRINYTDNNGLDGLHIQGNKGVEIATQKDGTVVTVKDGNVAINTITGFGKFRVKATPEDDFIAQFLYHDPNLNPPHYPRWL